MAFLFWLVPLGVGIAAGIALERRVLGRLTPLTGGITRGGVLVGTVGGSSAPSPPTPGRPVFASMVVALDVVDA